MTDPNLVRVLQGQTKSKVALIRYDTIAKGKDAVSANMDELRADGARFAIADAISDADLYTLGKACANAKLITGGSGIALGLPGNFRDAGLLTHVETASELPLINGRSVVIAGSASGATNGQVAEWRKSGRPSFRVEPLALSRGEPVVQQAVSFACAASEPVLIYATAAPDEVKAVQKALGVETAGQLVENALASVARELRGVGVRKFVVAGGETSGAVVQALAIKTLRIGSQIDPGIPVTQSMEEIPLALALKSGNFGSPRFFAKALETLDGAG